MKHAITQPDGRRSAGIMTTQTDNDPPFGSRSFYRRLCLAGQRIGLTMFVFTPQSVDWTARTVHGYAYDRKEDRWAPGVYSLPGVVYDRCFFSTRRDYADYRDTLRLLLEQQDTRLLGYSLKGKWTVQRMLQQTAEFAPHLPHTLELRSMRALADWLRAYPEAVLKPQSGSQGRGVLHVRRIADGERGERSERDEMAGGLPGGETTVGGNAASALAGARRGRGAGEAESSTGAVGAVTGAWRGGAFSAAARAQGDAGAGGAATRAQGGAGAGGAATRAQGDAGAGGAVTGALRGDATDGVGARAQGGAGAFCATTRAQGDAGAFCATTRAQGDAGAFCAATRAQGDAGAVGAAAGSPREAGASGAAEKAATPAFSVRGRDARNRSVARDFADAAALLRWLRRFIARRPYLLQQYLPLQQKQGGAYDIRALVQKDGDGRWQLTGVAVRQGQAGSLTSNLHGGGIALPAAPLLAREFGQAKGAALLAELTRLATRLPQTLEASHGRLAELGIDFGVDTGGNIWILEVNSKPGRSIFTYLKDEAAARAAVERPVHYAGYLLSRTPVR